jgi:hypothetical protein
MRRACALGVLLAATAAHADELPFPAIDQGPEPVVDPLHWTADSARPFMSIRGDAGYLYLKPRLAFGYGKPFTIWGGFDIVPFVTPDATGGYGGMRLQLDWFELRGGARFVHSFSRNYLDPAPSFDLVELAQNTHRPANYLAIEAEASAAIPAPAGFGNILATFTAESIQLVPANTYVFDEVLRVVVSPPPVYRGRLGYSFLLGKEKIARLGFVGEVIEIPDRNAQVWRAGLIGSFDIDDHLQVIATVLIPIVTPDSLGLLGADYTEIGFRYRWATGHKDVVARERIPSGGP